MTKIFVAGSNGLVGSSVLEYLYNHTDHKNILSPSHSELNLTNQAVVDDFFRTERPDRIVLSAARVGGIKANTDYQGDFIRDNLLIQTNTIEAARKYGCEKFCFLGSSCIYPRLCSQPIKEEYLLTSDLELSNISYAVAKIAGVQMIRAYRNQYSFPGHSLMPTNLYGKKDNFDLETSHVLPALIRKFHEAKLNGSEYVQVWGNGGKDVYREFLYVVDLARVIVATLFPEDFLPGKEVPELMNVGCGKDILIYDLALLIKDIVGFEGEIRYDESKPTGTPRKLLNIDLMTELGLRAEVELRDGISQTYKWYEENQ